MEIIPDALLTIKQDTYFTLIPLDLFVDMISIWYKVAEHSAKKWLHDSKNKIVDDTFIYRYHNIPYSIYTLTNLTRLESIKMCPETITVLTKLKELDISFSNLKSIPASFSHLIKVENNAVSQ